MGVPGSGYGRGRGAYLLVEKKILIIHTRPLCYYSAEFFLDRLQEAFEALGHEVVRIDLPEDEETFDSLEKLSGESFLFVLDINSKLPHLMLSDGTFFLDSLKAPFINYILDHPLYHHPGLNIPLKNYHAIALDGYHGAYIKKHYPHLRSVSCLPLAGTPALDPMPFSERKKELFFAGTYIKPYILDNEYKRLCKTFGFEYEKVYKDLYDLWDPYNEPLEEALEKYLKDNPGDTCSFPELLNRLHHLDRRKRNENRLGILREVSKLFPTVVVGEGWEDELFGLKPLPYANALQLHSVYRYALDISPAFLDGIHDRASNALASGCLLLSNMACKRGPKKGEDYLGFSGTDVYRAVESLKSLGEEKEQEMSRRGNDYYNKNLTWSNLEKKIIHITKEGDVII